MYHLASGLSRAFCLGKSVPSPLYTQATMTKMIGHCTQGGETIDQAIAWAADELEGFIGG